MSAASLSEDVVHAALGAYAQLPRHGKPAVRDNGVPEWTVLAAVALTDAARRVVPVALGTGAKVLPAARLPPLGDTLHDSHAEVLCRRGLVRWLLREAARVARGEPHEGLLFWDAARARFRLARGVQVWLYVSCLPCGDASTLHTAAHQGSEMADAFRAAPALTVAPDGAVRGRKGYENYGAIRTKPGRPDSPPSISFSCSDKIASWSVLGMQGALLAALFDPVYLDHIVVGGVDDVPPPGAEVPAGETWHGAVTNEAERALWGRLAGIPDSSVPAPYRRARPRVHLTPTPFPLSKPAVLALHPHAQPATSNVSLSYVPACGRAEVIINGCAQGSGWKAPGTTLLKDKQRSQLSKIEIMRAFLALREEMVGRTGGEPLPEETTYYDLKHAATTYQALKQAVRGAPTAPLSAAWAKMLPHEFAVTAASGHDPLPAASDPPFAGWIVCGARYEQFTRAGTLRSA